MAWILLVLSGTALMAQQAFRKYARDHMAEAAFAFLYIALLFTYNFVHWARAEFARFAIQVLPFVWCRYGSGFQNSEPFSTVWLLCPRYSPPAPPSALGTCFGLSAYELMSTSSPARLPGIWPSRHRGFVE